MIESFNITSSSINLKKVHVTQSLDVKKYKRETKNLPTKDYAGQTLKNFDLKPVRMSKADKIDS
jgi:hypothetical protein